MAEQKPEPVERIEASFRYGSTIIIGVLTGFSLAFLTAWASNPLPWGAKDLPAVVALVAGVIFELAAVWILLDPTSLELPVYRRAIRYFRIGVVLVGTGVFFGIAVDYVTVSNNFQAPVGGSGH
ncbi:hypothetical protein BH10PSE9_BH10PSE9_19810 [soil metagenome]